MERPARRPRRDRPEHASPTPLSNGAIYSSCCANRRKRRESPTRTRRDAAPSHGSRGDLHASATQTLWARSQWCIEACMTASGLRREAASQESSHSSFVHHSQTITTAWLACLTRRCAGVDRWRCLGRCDPSDGMVRYLIEPLYSPSPSPLRVRAWISRRRRGRSGLRRRTMRVRGAPDRLARCVAASPSSVHEAHRWRSLSAAKDTTERFVHSERGAALTWIVVERVVRSPLTLVRFGTGSGLVLEETGTPGAPMRWRSPRCRPHERSPGCRTHESVNVNDGGVLIE